MNTPRVFRFLLPIQRLLPYGIIKRIVSMNMGAPVGLTNIAGPGAPVYLGGQRVVGKYAIVGLQWPHACELSTALRDSNSIIIIVLS